MIKTAPPGRYDVCVGMYLPGGGRIPLANQGLSLDGQRCKTLELTVAKEPAAAPVERTFAERTPAVSPPAAPRPAPAARGQKIENQFVSVVLDADQPRVISIEHKPSGTRIRGGDSEAVLRAEIYDVAAKEFFHLPDGDGRLDRRSTVSPGEIRYHCSGIRRQQEVVAFDILLRLDKGQIDVRLDNIKEPDGFQLIGVTFPDVISTSDEKASLIIPWMRGRRVPVASGSARRFRFGLTWDTPVVTAMLCEGKLAAILDTTDYDNEIETRIESTSSRGRCAALTALFAHRIKASSPRRAW